MTKRKFKEVTDLAFNILENDTPYIRAKVTIKSFFKNENQSTKDIDSVITRLTIIDSFYSTNMSKRYYGIEEIAEELCKFDNLKSELIDYAENLTENEKLEKLFFNHYGYKKNGKKFGHAFSLITKYAYFLTDYNFPIYDSIVKEVYHLFSEDKRKLKTSIGKDYISSMKNLSKELLIDDFNKLDNLLWLVGKIRRSNFSLLLNKENYLKYKKTINTIKEQKIDTDKKDIKILTENYILFNKIFTKEQIEMIKFATSLNEISSSKQL